MTLLKSFIVLNSLSPSISGLEVNITKSNFVFEHIVEVLKFDLLFDKLFITSFISFTSMIFLSYTFCMFNSYFVNIVIFIINLILVFPQPKAINLFSGKINKPLSSVK